MRTANKYKNKLLLLGVLVALLSLAVSLGLFQNANDSDSQAAFVKPEISLGKSLLDKVKPAVVVVETAWGE